MEYRNSSGGVHFGHSLVASHESSHGVELTGGSTGAIAQAAGDDANITMIVRGKGTGRTQVGNSSAVVQLGASTTGISRFQRVRVDYTVPEIAANAVATSTYTAVGLTTNATMTFASDHLVAVHPNTVLVRAKCSTTDELRLDFANIAASSIGTGLSTAHGYLSWFNF